MSNLVPAGSAGIQLSSRSQRVLGRQLATIQSRTAVDLASIDAAAQRWEGVAQGVTSVTNVAQQCVALVAQAEQTIAQAVPQAAPRLALIGGMHAIAMASVVMDTAAALGRLA